MLAVFSAVRVLASGGTFDLPDAGCPQAHCNLQMTDQVGVTAPVSPTAIIYTDDLSIGATKGLGCSSNGVDTAACTFGVRVTNCPTGSETITNTLAIYRIDGAGDIDVWRSGTLLSCRAYASAPLVAEDGGIITADEKLAVRLAADNSIVWTTTHITEALPISPILVQTEGITQAVVVATGNLPNAAYAPIYAYDAASGDLLGPPLNLTVEGDRFATRNTPGGLNQRIYVSANGIADETAGRLFAVDVMTTGLTIAWGDEPEGQATTAFIAPAVEFVGPSGASPLVVPLEGFITQTMVLFDGNLEVNSEEQPHILAVQDGISGPSIVWTKTMTGPVRASFALDLRLTNTLTTTMWAFTTKPEDGTYADHRYLYRYRVADGNLVQVVDVDALVDEPGIYVPSSAISMAGNANEPVLIVAATRYNPTTGTPMKTFVIAIDLTVSIRQPLWKVELPYNVGQFPISTDATNGPLIWVNSWSEGVRVVGED
ncbi:MAG: hypothetical protein Fur0021_30420 [Candidatus Promineifilaceae bacterium]